MSPWDVQKNSGATKVYPLVYMADTIVGFVLRLSKKSRIKEKTRI